MFEYIVVIIALVAGSVFCIWLGDQITVKGFGNGTSILIFINIISRVPLTIYSFYTLYEAGTLDIVSLVLFILGAFILIVATIYISLAERRIPVQYAGKAVGSKMMKAQGTHIPLSIISAAVIAIIFAMSVMQFTGALGQFFPNKHKIEFTIVDMGLGFKNIINNRFKLSKTITSTQAIKWAVVDGHTTKTDVSGGLGLSLLEEFIKLNGGKFQIISDDGFYELGTTENTAFLETAFPGTIVNMEFRTDDVHSYSLSSEVNNIEDIF